MDNLIFEKIWIDGFEDLFLIKVSANNDRITMYSEVYAQSFMVSEFQNGAKNILEKSFTIKMGNDDDSEIDCVKLSFVSNKRGVISVSVFMKTYAYENKNDTAHFTIMTDIASLDRFSSELKQIPKGDIGVKVQLQ